MVAMVCAGTTLAGMAPRAAYGHGADANTAEIRLAGDTAYVVVWPPTEVFAMFDDDHDGRSQRTETDAHRKEILDFFREHFRLEDQAGRRGQLIFEDVSTPLSEWNRDDGAVHLRVTLRYHWKEAPAWLVLDYSLFASHPMLVRAARVAPGPSVLEQKLLAPPDAVVFDRDNARRTLLEASASREPAAVKDEPEEGNNSF